MSPLNFSNHSDDLTTDFQGNIPKDPNEIANEIGGHMISPDRLPEKAFGLSEYIVFCRNYLGDKLDNQYELIPTKLAEEKINEKFQSNYLQENLPANHTCCWAIIPCNRYGRKLSDREIKNGDYLVLLVKDERGFTVDGFSTDDSHLFQLIPAEIQQQCSFEIGMYSSDGDGFNTDHAPEDKVKLETRARAALNNAMKIFNQKAEEQN